MTCITVGERYGEDSATSLQMLLQADAKLHNADSGLKDRMYSYLFAINLDVSDVVLKHCGHIDLWKLVLTEHNEQTGLPAGSISNYDQLFPDRCHSCRQETGCGQKTAKVTTRGHFISNNREGHFIACRHCATTTTVVYCEKR